MSELAGWIVAAYLAGALALVMSDEPAGWLAEELIVLATWPISIPLGFVWSKVKRRQTTCHICGQCYGDRERLAYHKERQHVG